jgi:hypothetical protein
LRPLLEGLEDRRLLAVAVSGSFADVDYDFTSGFSDSSSAVNLTRTSESGNVSGQGHIVFTGPTSGITSLHATGTGSGTAHFPSGSTLPYTFVVTSFGGTFTVTDGAITGPFADQGVETNQVTGTNDYSLSGTLTAGSNVSFVSNPYPINLAFSGTEPDGTTFSGSTSGGKATNQNTTPTNIAAEVIPNLPPSSFGFKIVNSGTQMDAADPNTPLSKVKLYWSSSKDVADKLGEITLQGDAGIYWNMDSLTINNKFDDLPTGPKGAEYIVVVADGNNSLGSKVTVNTAAVKIPFVWTGKGSNDLWSNGDNWLAHTAPSAGDDLIFPAGALQQTNDNDLGYTFKSMTVGSASQSVTASSTFQSLAAVDTDYHISGKPLAVSDDLNFSSGSTTFESSATVAASTTVDEAATLKVGTNATLVVSTTSTMKVDGTVEASGEITLDGDLDNSGNVMVKPGAHLNASATGNFTAESKSTAHFSGIQEFSNGSTLTVNADGELDLDPSAQLNSSGQVTVNSQGTYNVDTNAVWTQAGGNFSLFGDFKAATGGKAIITGGANASQQDGSTSEIDGTLNIENGNWKLNAATSDHGAFLKIGAGGNVNVTGGASEFDVLAGTSVSGPDGSVKVDAGLFKIQGNVGLGFGVDAHFGIVVLPGGSLDVFKSLAEGEAGNLNVFGTLTIEAGATLTNTAGVITLEPGSTFNVLGTLTGPVTYAAPTVTSPAVAGIVSAATFAITGVAHSNNTVTLYSDPNRTGSPSGNGVGLVSSQTAATDGAYSFTVSLTPGAVNNYFVTATVGGTQTGPTIVPSLTQRSLPWQNPIKRHDVTGDGIVAPNDIVALVLQLNGYGAHGLSAMKPSGDPFYDVDGDTVLAPKDIVDVIIYLNAFGAGEGEAAAASSKPVPLQAAAHSTTDALFAQLAEETASQQKRLL